MLSKRLFMKEVSSLKQTYRVNDSWVDWLGWEDDLRMKLLMEIAYKLYRATATNALQLTLLGDTEIRKMTELIRNFGLASASGVQGGEYVEYSIGKKNDDHGVKMDVMVDRLENERSALQKKAKVSMGKLLGPGSILSDKNWTTILNDALILGAIHSKQPLYLALNTKEQAAWQATGYGKFKVNLRGKIKAYNDRNAEIKEFNNRNAEIKAINDRSSKVEADDKDKTVKHKTVKHKTVTEADSYKGYWLSFLRKQPQMLWNEQREIPRVLARELLGLKFFGYKPVYSRMGLGFESNPNASNSTIPPSFKKYLDNLSAVSFFKNDREKILGEVSEFLFGDKKALTKKFYEPPKR